MCMNARSAALHTYFMFLPLSCIFHGILCVGQNVNICFQFFLFILVYQTSLPDPIRSQITIYYGAGPGFFVGRDFDDLLVGSSGTLSIFVFRKRRRVC